MKTINYFWNHQITYLSYCVPHGVKKKPRRRHCVPHDVFKHYSSHILRYLYQFQKLLLVLKNYSSSPIRSGSEAEALLCMMYPKITHLWCGGTHYVFKGHLIFLKVTYRRCRVPHSVFDCYLTFLKVIHPEVLCTI